MPRHSPLLALLWIAASATNTLAQTVIVPDDYPTIQQALDAGNLEILVRPGTYLETPVITYLGSNGDTDDLVLRGLVPQGTPPDSLPLIAGLIFEDLVSEYWYSPSATIADLRFSKAVQNRFNTAPFSNPLILIFEGCVFDKGIDDAGATIGGQLQYTFRHCTIDGGTRGALFLVQPDRAYLHSCLVRDRVTFGDESHSSFFFLTNSRIVNPRGWQPGVAVEVLYAEIDVVIQGNTFEAYEIPLRVQPNNTYLLITNNSFIGPGSYGADLGSSGIVDFTGNRITGFDTGLRVEHAPVTNGPYVILSDNRIEGCEVAGIRVVGADNITSTRDTVLSCGAGAILRATDTYATPGVIVEEDVILSCSGTGLSTWSEYARIRGNVVGRCGGTGIEAEVASTVWWETIELTRNTSFLNTGSGYFLNHTGQLAGQIDHNIGYLNGQYGLEVTANLPPTIGCNDWFSNAQGAVQGIKPGGTDLAVDPLFCYVAENDVHLAVASPLADPTACGLIGALGIGCETTPVLVDQFTASRGPGGGIVVGWRILRDPDARVHVERSEEPHGPWGLVVGTITADGALRTIVDGHAQPGRAYWYRLIEDDAGAGAMVLATTHVEAWSPAFRFALDPIGGVPGTGPFRVQFRLPAVAPVELDVFDVLGRRVARLSSGEWPAGVHALQWSGCDAKGEPLAGIHFVRFRFPGGQSTQRLVLLH